MRLSSAVGVTSYVHKVIDIDVEGLPSGDGDREALVEELRWIYGRDSAIDWLDNGPARDYPIMIKAAHDALAAADVLDEVSVVVLAYSMPDLQVERLLGGFVSSLFRGALTFCVAEQDVAGPFTALRLAHEQLLVQGGSALVLALEQSTLPTTAFRVPEKDGAVAIILGHRSIGRPIHELVVARRSSAASRFAGGVLKGAGRAGYQIVGSEVGMPYEHGARAASVARADSRSASTGVWEVVAARWDSVRSATQLVVQERSERLGYDCVLVLGARVDDRPTKSACLKNRDCIMSTDPSS